MNIFSIIDYMIYFFSCAQNYSPICFRHFFHYSTFNINQSSPTKMNTSKIKQFIISKYPEIIPTATPTAAPSHFPMKLISVL